MKRRTKSLSGKWVARATRPPRSATRRPERQWQCQRETRWDWCRTLFPFRLARRQTAQAGSLCYPTLNFDTRALACSDPRLRRADGAPFLRHLRGWSLWLCAGALLWNCPTFAANLPQDWQHVQQFNVTAPGLVKLSLPRETLDAARPALEDLRLYDDTGNELAYLIERPTAVGKVVQAARSFQVSLNAGVTVITLQTGLAQPIDGVTLETPAGNFIKSVQVEGSADGTRWQPLAQGLPIFRQRAGADQLHLPFPAGPWPWLRVSVDDQRSQPIPFTGARIHAASAEPTPSEPLPVTITERHENPGETRLTLNLGAANLTLANLQIETAEPLFTRSVTLAVPEVSEDSIREQPVGHGVIYRVALEGQPASANLTLPLERQILSRELLLLIKNQDSPPLPIRTVRADRRPVHLLFLARQSGPHHLLTGNSHCAAPHYDLSALGGNLKQATVSALSLSPVTSNPNYRPPEVLAGLQEDGTALDVTEWRYRKAITVNREGAQQVELDLETLAHAQPGFHDLRVLRGGKQVPYVLERTSISRALTPTVTLTNDAKNPKLSRWIIQLPLARLPITRLVCATRTPLFQRDLTLYDDATDERGGKYRRHLAQASWIQTPDRAGKEFTLTISGSLQGDTLFLETDNGDNPPIELAEFRAFYPATRLLFKAKPADQLFLYYGNPRVLPPRYDLGLVAGQLLSADRAAATLGTEEQLKKPTWAEGRRAGKGGVLFWGILALVVAVLLAIISRLLPKASGRT